MFSLPISAEMWLGWSILLLVFTWFIMLYSGLLILEANLNFEPRTSFETFVRNTLGTTWSHINGLTLAFVLYILTYAYISGGGSIISHVLQTSMGLSPNPKIAGLMFALGLSSIVWFSTGLVGRVTAILITGMLISFVLSVSNRGLQVQSALLLDNRLSYAPFLFAAMPYYLTSFGFHANVPSLMKY